MLCWLGFAQTEPCDEYSALLQHQSFIQNLENPILKCYFRRHNAQFLQHFLQVCAEPQEVNTIFKAFLVKRGRNFNQQPTVQDRGTVFKEIKTNKKIAYSSACLCIHIEHCKRKFHQRSLKKHHKQFNDNTEPHIYIAQKICPPRSFFITL